MCQGPVGKNGNLLINLIALRCPKTSIDVFPTRNEMIKCRKTIFFCLFFPINICTCFFSHSYVNQVL